MNMKELEYERAILAKKWLQLLKYDVSDACGGMIQFDPEKMAEIVFSIREDGKIRLVSGEQLIDFAKSKGWEG